jgi:DNA-directed RNA polymerase subunit omega
VKIENVIDHIGNRFATVVVAARRARQINAYYTGLGSNEGKNIPPQVNSLSRKPLTIAMEEIANGLVEAEHQEPQENLPVL